jgi:hypothetical protein
MGRFTRSRVLSTALEIFAARVPLAAQRANSDAGQTFQFSHGQTGYQELPAAALRAACGNPYGSHPLGHYLRRARQRARDSKQERGNAPAEDPNR